MFSFFGNSKCFQKLLTRKQEVSTKRRKAALQCEALESRLVPTTLTVGAGQQYATIPAAIAAVTNPSKTTIDVEPGTYGAFSVPSNMTGLTISGEPSGNNQVLIQPTTITPLPLNGVSVGGAAIDIYASSVTLSGFTVDGSMESDGNMWAGIRVIDNAQSCMISGNTVENITQGPANTNVGIQIGTSLTTGANATGSGTISGNTILNYQGAGVLVDGTGSAAQIAGNTIIGRGTGNGGIPEYGVEINGNDNTNKPGNTQFNISGNTISGNTISGSTGAPNNPEVTSAGIFIYEDKIQVQSHITGNTLTGNDDGVLVQTDNNGNHLSISGNTISGNYGYAGIFLLSTSGVIVELNTVSNNLTYNGIALNFSNSNTIETNTISGNGSPTSQSDGIFDLGGTSNLITGNTSDSNSGNGINLTDTTGDMVNGNTANSNTLSGIYDQGGNADQIGTGGGNTFSTNGLYGANLNGVANVQLNGASKSSNNVFTDNTSYAIYVQSNSSGVEINYDTMESPTKLWIGFDASGSSQVVQENNDTFGTN